jgi:hypothetical protein
MSIGATGFASAHCPVGDAALAQRAALSVLQGRTCLAGGKLQTALPPLGLPFAVSFALLCQQLATLLLAQPAQIGRVTLIAR